jgi:hypothetical protein
MVHGTAQALMKDYIGTIAGAVPGILVGYVMGYYQLILMGNDESVFTGLIVGWLMALALSRLHIHLPKRTSLERLL